MNSLDKSINMLKERTWLSSLVCAIFVLYPNIAWFMCDMEQVEPERHYLFVLFFIFRTIYLWATMWGLIVLNMRSMRTLNLFKRAGMSLVASMALFGVYMLVTDVLLSFNFDYFISIVVFQFIIIALIGTMLGYIYLLYTSEREKDKEIERLKVENLQSRCDALMNQINPHFFFNALNGVSALVRQGDEERTLRYVDKVSDIFRYILQSEQRSVVELGEELEFVEAFSHVMQVRFAKKLQFDVSVAENKYNLKIPVLSLLPLLENVTVHNTIDSEHRMKVDIRLSERDELVVKNQIYPKLQRPTTNGIGIKNLTSRFELLIGTKVVAKAEEEVFTVVMPLKKL